MSKNLSREELIRLVEHIQSASGCVTDLDALLNRFEAQVPCPEASQWIFDPPDGKPLSAAEIVDAALRKR